MVRDWLSGAQGELPCRCIHTFPATKGRRLLCFSAAGYSISVIARPGKIDNIAGTEAQSTSQGALFGASR